MRKFIVLVGIASCMHVPVIFSSERLLIEAPVAAGSFGFDIDIYIKQLLIDAADHAGRDSDAVVRAFRCKKKVVAYDCSDCVSICSAELYNAVVVSLSEIWRSQPLLFGAIAREKLSLLCDKDGVMDRLSAEILAELGIEGPSILQYFKAELIEHGKWADLEVPVCAFGDLITYLKIRGCATMRVTHLQGLLREYEKTFDEFIDDRLALNTGQLVGEVEHLAAQFYEEYAFEIEIFEQKEMKVLRQKVIKFSAGVPALQKILQRCERLALLQHCVFLLERIVQRFPVVEAAV